MIYIMVAYPFPSFVSKHVVLHIVPSLCHLIQVCHPTRQRFLVIAVAMTFRPVPQGGAVRISICSPLDVEMLPLDWLLPVRWTSHCTLRNTQQVSKADPNADLKSHIFVFLISTGM